MKLKLHPKLKNGYAISATAHLILLLIMALMLIKPHLPLQWHSFEWQLADKIPSVEASTARGVTQHPAAKQSEIKQESSTADISAAPAPIAEEKKAIETPKVSEAASSEAVNNPVRINRSRTSSALRSLGDALPGGNFGFSANLEEGGGDAYAINQPKPLIVPTEEGEVLVEFKLTAKGDVDMQSLKVLSYSSGAYMEAVRKAMQGWKFGFRGTYNPNRVYRIRCRFVVNEN